MYVGALSLSALIGFATYSLTGFPDRFSGEVADALKAHDFRFPWQECLLAEEELPPSKLCQSSKKYRPSVAVIGDSHAVHYYSGIATYLSSHRIGAVLIPHSGCSSLPGMDKALLDKKPFITCGDLTEKLIQYVQDDDEIKTVIIASRFAMWIEGRLFGRERRMLLEVHSDRYSDARSNVEFVASSLDNIVYRFIKLGKHVVILSQVPEMNVDAPKCYARGLENCDIAEQDVLLRQNRLRHILDAISCRHPEVCVFDPLPHFCSDGICKSKIGGKIMYLDNNHLNLDGSHYISQFFNFERCLQPSDQK